MLLQVLKETHMTERKGWVKEKADLGKQIHKLSALTERPNVTNETSEASVAETSEPEKEHEEEENIVRHKPRTRKEYLEQRKECGNASNDPKEKGMTAPRLISKRSEGVPTNVEGASDLVRWGIVFPFHGNKGSQRLRSVQMAWASIARAVKFSVDIQNKKYKPWSFDVLFVDDSDDQSWLPDTPILNTWRCSRKENCTAKGWIYMHLKRGYRWAYESNMDYIIHFDSDLLLR